jgi:hypothetical protein
MNLFFEVLDKPLVDDLAMLAGSQMCGLLGTLRIRAGGKLDEADDRDVFHSLTPLGNPFITEDVFPSGIPADQRTF